MKSSMRSSIPDGSETISGSPSATPPTETGSTDIPKPRFQAAPKTIDSEKKRKPLPRHIVKQILAANSEAIMARPPWLEEMEARRRATKPERDKARSLRREADVERRTNQRLRLTRPVSPRPQGPFACKGR